MRSRKVNLYILLMRIRNLAGPCSLPHRKLYSPQSSISLSSQQAGVEASTAKRKNQSQYSGRSQTISASGSSQSRLFALVNLILSILIALTIKPSRPNRAEGFPSAAKSVLYSPGEASPRAIGRDSRRHRTIEGPLGGYRKVTK